MAHQTRRDLFARSRTRWLCTLTRQAYKLPFAVPPSANFAAAKEVVEGGAQYLGLISMTFRNLPGYMHRGQSQSENKPVALADSSTDAWQHRRPSRRHRKALPPDSYGSRKHVQKASNPGTRNFWPPILRRGRTRLSIGDTTLLRHRWR
ncbi:hypothetical protein HETIRDRAFT_106656 [Heterobasidion irregulare TC 32-1]|uniref:Uncharacterized protein n=1 Tax=Heterobasidion irregulare (strain TC 32-1) TaxID=747525 RepID=W4JSF8_HETIT|nr:uncharacterized protein HETIRDRAFT_106656 [Heterobasidion irregulare TC 32-1]ETW76045.1 hypothetical protein HETIRDRAFT_106656 [Heterobasidion irregulare TC 32-1]